MKVGPKSSLRPFLHRALQLLNLNISILWFGVLKAVIVSAAPMPGQLFCSFCLSNAPAATLNYDVAVHCCVQTPHLSILTVCLLLFLWSGCHNSLMCSCSFNFVRKHATVYCS